MLKRGYTGAYHKMSVKHLFRYVNEFAGRHNVRDQGTIHQMTILALGLTNRRLKYDDLIATPEMERDRRTSLDSDLGYIRSSRT